MLELQSEIYTEAAYLAEAERALARNDYAFYVEWVHNGAYKHGRHTEDIICKELEKVERGELDRLIITLPPRHSKSMTVTETFPSWFIGRKPSRRVIATAYSGNLAKKFGRLNKQKLRQYGEELFEVSLLTDNKSNTNWGVLGHRGGMISAGIGGAITGEGADLMIIDDPFKNRKQADSIVYRDMVWDEWQNTLRTRLHPGGAVIVIMTRWHEDDLVGRLLADPEEGDKWKIVNLPCECEDENDPLGRKIGEPLWPEHGYDKAWMEQTKTDVGTRTWASLYQQRPSPKEGVTFKRDWWQFYKVLPEFIEETAQSWDCAFKGIPEETDYVVGLVGARKAGNYYIIDRFRDQVGIKGTIQAIRSMTGKHPTAYSKWVEEKANGAAVIELLRDEIPGMIPVPNSDGKEARANAVQPFVESGNVYLPDPSIAPWVHDFIEELAQFPSGKHDDQVDAFTQLIIMLRSKTIDPSAMNLLRKAKVY